MSLAVTQKSIPDILTLLRKGEWQVPKFQREFIWSKSQVYALLNSIFASRPIGLITLWAQPQGSPATPSEPIKIRNAEFKHFAKNPAVMKLILDGRQRLTAITMAFGGLSSPDDRYLYSGKWFLNLSEDLDSEKIIDFKKKKQISALQLDSIPNCLAKALIPLDSYQQFGEYNQNIHNPQLYPKGAFPNDATRQKRSRRLSQFYETFMNFDVPVAEIPENITLPQVCDIFDVLNTTGTKVSTFDIIHNLLYSDTAGKFEPRRLFASCPDSMASFRLLCGSSRQEVFCQTVTGCYISGPKPKARQGTELISSLKGGDLMGTPTPFYQSFSTNLPKIDTYCNTLFSDVLDGDFRLRELPYPVSTILYISLHWFAEMHQPTERFTTDQLNRLFRAFFWRNALTGRYDQGFLTRFTSDQLALKNILKKARKATDWISRVNKGLEEHFGEQYSALSKERIQQLLLDSEIRGALRQAFSVFIYSRAKTEWLAGTELNRFSEEKGALVHLHHMFPQAWCKDNAAANNKFIKKNEAMIDSFANLVPLMARSNNDWRTKSPGTAIIEFDLDFAADDRFSTALVDKDSFDFLIHDDPGGFWNRRAIQMAGELYNLQFVS